MTEIICPTPKLPQRFVMASPVRSGSDPFHVSQDVCSLYGACPNLPHNIGHRFQPGSIVYERSRRSALRFLPRHKFFRQFLDRQIPVFDDFFFLKALPCFEQKFRFVLLGLSDHPQDVLFFHREFSKFNGAAALCVKYEFFGLLLCFKESAVAFPDSRQSHGYPYPVTFSVWQLLERFAWKNAPEKSNWVGWGSNPQPTP